jgi:hypothetical protein
MGEKELVEVRNFGSFDDFGVLAMMSLQTAIPM